MTRLTERSALVTGASRGIGRAVALAFAKEGANVTVSARSTDALDDLVREITEIGGSALAVAADLAQEDEIAPIAEAARERFGSVDILVNNAGIIHPPIDLVDFDAGLWRQVIDVNLIAVALLTKAVLPGMIAQESGKIINLASICRQHGFPAGHFSNLRPVLSELADDGLILYSGAQLTLTKQGRRFSRNVAAIFDAYLDPTGTGKHSTAS